MEKNIIFALTPFQRQTLAFVLHSVGNFQQIHGADGEIEYESVRLPGVCLTAAELDALNDAGKILITGFSGFMALPA